MPATRYLSNTHLGYGYFRSCGIACDRLTIADICGDQTGNHTKGPEASRKPHRIYWFITLNLVNFSITRSLDRNFVKVNFGHKCLLFFRVSSRVFVILSKSCWNSKWKKMGSISGPECRMEVSIVSGTVFHPHRIQPIHRKLGLECAGGFFHPAVTKIDAHDGGSIWGTLVKVGSFSVYSVIS